MRWTCKSKDKLASELGAMGHKVSATKVGRLLHELGYSLQVVRKTREGTQSPDRNAQFEYINRTAKECHKGAVISLCTRRLGRCNSRSNASRRTSLARSASKKVFSEQPGDARRFLENLLDGKLTMTPIETW